MKYYSIHFNNVAQLKNIMTSVSRIFIKKGIYCINFTKKYGYYDFTIGDRLTFVCIARTDYNQKNIHEYLVNLKILDRYSVINRFNDDPERIYDWMVDKYRDRAAAYFDYNIYPQIKKVIFNNPATIVFWTDGSKTVVKCSESIWDPEKGLAMAISKKRFGNKGNYYNEFKKWLS